MPPTTSTLQRTEPYTVQTEQHHQDAGTRFARHYTARAYLVAFDGPAATGHMLDPEATLAEDTRKAAKAAAEMGLSVRGDGAYPVYVWREVYPEVRWCGALIRHRR